MLRINLKSIISVLCFMIASVCSAQQIDIVLSPSLQELIMIENCNQDSATIQIAGVDQATALTLAISTGGSATPGEDYVLISPDTAALLPDSVLNLELVLLGDDVIEGTENLTISVFDVESGSQLQAIDIQIQDQLEVQIAGADQVEFCPDEEFSLQALGNGPLLNWTYGEQQVFGDSVTFTATAPGSIIASRSYGQCTVSDSVDLTLKATATIDQGDTLFICLPNPGNLSVTTSGQVGEISWMAPDTSLSNLVGNATQANPIVTTTYTMTFQSADCIIHDTVVVRVDSLPEEMPITVVPEKEDYCPGEIVTLFSRYLGPIGFPDAEYAWMFDAGSPLSAQNLENFVFSTVDTSVFRRVTTNNACMITDTVEIIVLNPPVELNITDTMVCPNEPVQLILETADQLDEFEWMPPEGLSDPMRADPIARTPMSTTYTVTGMIKDCPASASVSINIIPDELLTLAPDTIVCPGDPVTLSVLDPGDFGDFQWSGENLSCTNCAAPTATPSSGSSYLVLGVNEQGCTASGAITIPTFGLSFPVITANPPGEIAQGASVTLTTEGGGQSYSWTRNGTSIEGDAETITATVVEESNVFRVDIINAQGCLITGEITIIGVPPSFDIPNAFTPNADDLNDRFRVIIMGSIELLELKIFNRWGQVVFNDNNESGWDGRIDGENAPSEVYAYQAMLRFPDGRTETARGEVMLIR